MGFAGTFPSSHEQLFKLNKMSKYSGVPNSVGALIVWGGPKFPKSNSMEGVDIFEKKLVWGDYRKLGVTSPNKKPYLQ